MDASEPVTASDLWVESYQGEVLGESLFARLAERERDPEHRHQLEMLTVLERATKELAEPVLEKRALDWGDTAASETTAAQFADGLAGTSWEEFLGSFEPVISDFLAKYRKLTDLAESETERSVAEAYVAHELALASFVRRGLGHEPGEPLAEILALPHVAAALAT
ncbi:MAG TPA: hypothetical protein VG032_07195 [Acidimicrobiales bacterium]|nr:hypothetical protein [Acidimicrobiales bacterium]